MKTIGLIGGTTWLSTIDYYRIINQEVNRQLGDLHSAKLLLYSIDFDEFKTLADAGKWPKLTEWFAGIAQQLQAAGINAQFRTIAGATMASIWYQGINMYFEEQNFGYPNSELLTDGSFYAYFTSQGPAQGHHAFVDPVVEKHYNDTVAALEGATTNDQIVQNEKALQGIIATSLPSVPLFYPDFIWAYNSQKVVGWPQPPTSFEVPGGTFNITALANVYSPSALTTTSTTSTGPGNGPSSGGLDSTLIAAGIVVAALIIVGGAMLMRRQPKK